MDTRRYRVKAIFCFKLVQKFFLLYLPAVEFALSIFLTNFSSFILMYFITTQPQNTRKNTRIFSSLYGFGVCDEANL